MASSLSNLVDNLSGEIHEVKYTNCNKCCLEYKIFKDGLIEFKFLCCNKSFQKKFDENLKKKHFNTYKFAKQGIKFILLLWKGVYRYEYINWEKFNETWLPEKEDFHSHLNMEDITEADYKYAKRVCKDFKIKDLSEYHGLCVQSDILLLADICRNKNELDPARVFCSRVSMVSSLK